MRGRESKKRIINVFLDVNTVQARLRHREQKHTKQNKMSQKFYCEQNKSL